MEAAATAYKTIMENIGKFQFIGQAIVGWGHVNYGVIATVTERSEEMPVVQSLDLLRCALQQPHRPGNERRAAGSNVVP